MTICVKCIVSGKVQGVFFRASTQQQANLLGISGYAQNLKDGCVEVLACAAEDQVEQLKAWLWQGSQWSEVDHVQCQKVELENIPSLFITS